ncbi:hypothetical protein [Baekduia soli]|uniref:hypothetical protein n=1 Tax=Baekduia soli TaxID=496014 RepID=UPI001652528F|nr:hypothetical protein [Baekduia soli]
MSIAGRPCGAISIAVAATLAACGGHRPSDQARVADVLHTFLRAQADGDGPTACAQLGAEGRADLVRVVARRAGAAGAAPASCEDAVGLVRLVAPAAFLEALRGADVGHVVVTGTTARAEVADGTQFPRQRVALAKREGRWRIVAVPGLLPG